jgi:ergothioneine biosynthesis glutamate--cysteine ligase EgtA
METRTAEPAAPAPTRGDASSVAGPDLEGGRIRMAANSATGIRQRTIGLDLEGARAQVAAAALADAPVGQVGLELEGHLVDLDRPAVRVAWSRVLDVVRHLPELPGGSRVTVEPGGQVELSGPPAPDAVAAISAMRRDEAVLRFALSGWRLGWALLGADPVRPPSRINPTGRYAAMERHFAATGQGRAGLVMMTSTCALQVNLQPGRPDQHAARVRQADRLGPVLVALSASSAWLGGTRTGWRSSRERAWGQLDQARCGPPPPSPDPAGAWADHALCAPVLLVRDPDGGPEQPVLRDVPFDRWLTGADRLGGRRPTASDLDYHLTTLFPPTRPRGFLELRCLDAVPSAWWPGLVALVTTLMDHPAAADAAAEAAEPVTGRWSTAAQSGIADPALRRAAVRCVQAAALAVPRHLRADVEAWAELVCAGRVPGDDVDERARQVGPLALLGEESRA